jgi:hypothetical protein
VVNIVSGATRELVYGTNEQPLWFPPPSTTPQLFTCLEPTSRVLVQVRDSQRCLTVYAVVDLATRIAREQVRRANGQPSWSSPPSMTPRLLASLKLAFRMLIPWPQSCSPRLIPSFWEPWALSHPPTVTFYFEGPHFSYDPTSSFHGGRKITPASYKDLLIGTPIHCEVNIHRNINEIGYVYFAVP